MSRVSWVKIVTDSEASGNVKEMYDAVRHKGDVENLYLACSAFPTPISTADKLYKAIMHATNGPLCAWECEMAATYVAILTNCRYAIMHHGTNFIHYYDDQQAAQKILDLLEQNEIAEFLQPQHKAMLAYTRKLTLSPEDLEETDIVILRQSGLDDSQIVHLNQVVSNFNYWIRVINGLGITLGKTPIGLDFE